MFFYWGEEQPQLIIAISEVAIKVLRTTNSNGIGYLQFDAMERV
jgi:hypothetical protein